jgi:PKD repeat protein
MNYTDYSSSSNFLEAHQGSNVLLKLNITPAFSERIRTWIDYNQDGDFSYNELLSPTKVVAAGDSVYIPFVIPNNALLGATRMRIRSVFGVNTFDACSNYTYGETEDYLVNVLPPLNNDSVAAMFNNPINLCKGIGSTFTNLSLHATSYLWTFEGGNPATSNQANPTVIWDSTGTKIVTLIASNAYGSDTISMTLNIIGNPPAPTLSTLNNSGFGYYTIVSNVIGLWSNGSTTPSYSINVSTPGTYYETITNSCGFSTVSSPVIIANPCNLIPVISAIGSTSLCGTGSVTLVSTQNGNWSNGITNADTIVVTTPGNYTQIVANSCGTAVISNVVAVTQASTLIISAQGPTFYCNSSNVTLTGNNGGVWSNGDTSSSITVHTPGDYYVTNTSNCGLTTSNIIHVAPYDTVQYVYNISSCQPVLLSPPAGFTQFIWNNGSTNSDYLATTSGTYSVTFTDANGCSFTRYHNVDILDPDPVITFDGITLSTDSFALYQWKFQGVNIPNATSQTYTPTQLGTYTAVVSNLACIDSVSYTVSSLPSSCHAQFTLVADTITAHNWYALNQSYGTGTINYSWNWGDGSAPDSSPTPSHIYTTPGYYPICLTITDSTLCSSSYCDSSTYISKSNANTMITIQVVNQLPPPVFTGLTNTANENDRLLLYPNPSKGVYVIKNGWAQSIEVFNLLGESVLKLNNVNSFSIINEPSGIYFCKINHNKLVKLMKE